MLKSVISAVSRKPATVGSAFDFEAALIALGNVVEQQSAEAIKHYDAAAVAEGKRLTAVAEVRAASRLITELKTILEL